MNKERLLQVATAIEDTPDHFDMNHWCGTCVCIAGYAAGMTGQGADNCDISGLARDWFDLTYEESRPLFSPRSYELPLRFIDFEDMTYNVPPAAAVAVIRHFAETGKIDWTIDY